MRDASVAMALSDHTVRATIAVSEMGAAREFYEGLLGLSPREGGPEEIRIYECGTGSLLQVYASPDHAGKATATAASWSVPDFDEQIDSLISKGVAFERDQELGGDERGVHTFGAHKVAWCKDPDGNTIAIDNGETGGY